MDLYVWHVDGTQRYSEQLFRNLVSDGAIENQDICVILEQYKKRDFYNLAFPDYPIQTGYRWEYIAR